MRRCVVWLAFSTANVLPCATSVAQSRRPRVRGDFKPASIPVALRVLGRETIEAAGRRWSTVVVQPIIETSTMFSDGQGRVWLSGDSARTIVRLNAKAAIGSITVTRRVLQPECCFGHRVRRKKTSPHSPASC